MDNIVSNKVGIPDEEFEKMVRESLSQAKEENPDITEVAFLRKRANEILSDKVNKHHIQEANNIMKGRTDYKESLDKFISSIAQDDFASADTHVNNTIKQKAETMIKERSKKYLENIANT